MLGIIHQWMNRKQPKYILWKLAKINKLEIYWHWYLKKQLNSHGSQGENVEIEWEFHTQEQIKEMVWTTQVEDIQHVSKTKEWREKSCSLCLYVFYC